MANEGRVQIAASEKYRMLTMAITQEERPYLLAAVRHYYPAMSMSAFLRMCFTNELGRLAEEKGKTVSDLLTEAIAAEGTATSRTG